MDDKTTRSIIEDLLPLYHKGLLRDETVRWLEQKIRDNPDFRERSDQAMRPIPGQVPDGPTDGGARR